MRRTGGALKKAKVRSEKIRISARARRAAIRTVAACLACAGPVKVK